ncbi:MAG TPA: DUF4167 domain-containing protein [Sphingomonas sp.]|uniref:DUF4167 domain-containing protein n=1 Tax=Sphingomonas sp. TaxID=28214 RepID=UPI002B76F761|nr:DUF4167 domain-containing protein [Sphingomonas sp.]HMI20928.1 DUF4167 domain-containing protein [Sphingomonas sp.]
MINNRQNGRRRGRGGQQARNGQPGGPDRGSRLDNRARGNAAQLLEKYKTLARDAQMQGDRVNTEYYLQFADHYFRVLSENRARFEEQRPRQPNDRDEFGGGDEDGGDANQQRYQGNDDQGGGDDWYDDQPQSQPQSQPQAEQQREPRRERQASPNENDGERGGNREAPREGNRERGRRNGNTGANVNANGNNGGNSYANGNGNGFAAPDFLSEPLAPRYEREVEDDDVQAAGADAGAAKEAAPKPRRPRRPRSETAEV